MASGIESLLDALKQSGVDVDELGAGGGTGNQREGSDGAAATDGSSGSNGSGNRGPDLREPASRDIQLPFAVQGQGLHGGQPPDGRCRLRHHFIVYGGASQ